MVPLVVAVSLGIGLWSRSLLVGATVFAIECAVAPVPAVRAQMRVTVTSSHVIVRRRLARRRELALRDVEHVDVVDIERPGPGFARRFWRHEPLEVYSFWHRTGVRLLLRNGDVVTVGSRTPGRLAAAIVERGHGRIRDALPDARHALPPANVRG